MTTSPDGPVDLHAQVGVAAAIAVEAGELALRLRSRGVEVEQKGPGDLVSEADRAVEALIGRRLAVAFPDDHVVGEEGAGAGEPVADGARTWYVDPIDGTTNYLKGLPAWGVSMGLVDATGAVLLGVIVLPATGEVFSAARGQGARRNGVPIRCASETRLDRALIAYAMPGRSAEQWGAEVFGRVRTLMSQALGTRMHGCAVADLTAVAAGRVDAVVAGGMSSWDVAAGLLIAAEAGARITTPDGATPLDPAAAFIVSAAPLHVAIRAILVGPEAVSA